MNKAEKAVQKASLNDEKRTIRELKQVYGQAKKDVEERIRNLSSRTDMENIQSIIYQKKYQEALKKQLDDVLDKLNTGQFDTVSDYLKVCYENGYVGSMYDLHYQGIPMTLPINQKKVVKALQTDTKLSSRKYKGNPLKGRLAEDIDRLKVSIRAELSRSVANGSSWNEVAVKIARGMNNPFDKAYRSALLIARTEGHRIQQSATLDAQYAAKEKGADIVKQWDSTLDNNTRPHHRQLDGQIRELDEPFEVDGMTADAPGHFGKAKEDCNCRCCLLQRARWALDEDELNELKERAAYFGLDKSADFADFKQKYLKAANLEDLEKQFSDMTDGYSYDDFMNDFASIEEGFEGMDDVEIQKAKTIAEQIESLRSEMNLKANRTRTKQESIEILKNLGIEFKESSTKPISDEVLDKYVDFVTGFENTHARYFNSNKVQLKKISIVDDVKGVSASGIYRSGTKGIEIKRARIQSKQSPIFSKSDDNELHVLAHEYGHYISDTLGKNLGITEADIVQKAINKYYDGDIFKSTKDLKDCLSSYGSTSYQEAFAEAFAEAYTCENPRKFARIFREELEKVMK